METLRRKLILAIASLTIISNCGIPRDICHQRVEEIEGYRCQQFFLTYLILRGAGRDADADKAAGPTAAVCIIAEKARKNCKDELNIPWFGI
ncbi:MAG: hypothetical protein CMF59_06490 [Leptospiraceae bacterium]|nr:hypothetical protein [Leptospiraceae bacterium]